MCIVLTVIRSHRDRHSIHCSGQPRARTIARSCAQHVEHLGDVAIRRTDSLKRSPLYPIVQAVRRTARTPTVMASARSPTAIQLGLRHGCGRSVYAFGRVTSTSWGRTEPRRRPRVLLDRAKMPPHAVEHLRHILVRQLRHEARNVPLSRCRDGWVKSNAVGNPN